MGHRFEDDSSPVKCEKNGNGHMTATFETQSTLSHLFCLPLPLPAVSLLTCVPSWIASYLHTRVPVPHGHSQGLCLATVANDTIAMTAPPLEAVSDPAS